MTVEQLRKWLLEQIDKHKLSQKKYLEVKGLMNQLYDLCISYDIVQINLPRQISTPSENVFFEPEEKTKNTAYLAI